MTNKEILQADLLDILFENRNKAYGAYALRKNYSHRLQWALGISLSCTWLFLFAISTGDKSFGKPVFDTTEITVATDNSPKMKPKEPVSSKPRHQPRLAEIKSTSQIEIVDNSKKTDMPDQTQINQATISDKSADGLPADGTAQNDITRNNPESNKISEATSDEKTPIISHSDAQFPGGRQAFTEFLKKYLVTPGDLEAGEKKAVLVRFIVDADGTISKTEIVQSGGDKYDKEVIRVLRKMPKWVPAMQNGIRVATYFTQPVTFIGIEE